MQRPSNKELFNKLKQARENIEAATPENHRLIPVDISVIAQDAIELGYQIGNLRRILLQLLGEVGIQHYVGDHPPQKSYKKVSFRLDLFPFVWESTRLGCEVYLKFCIQAQIFYLHSLHKNRPQL